jgi:tRNA dimethylallyltransferase
MQIYRWMDIGTAKPTLSEQARVRHHMIDIREPAESFDAAAFTEAARKVIRQLTEHGVLPFVVGGTGLYIKALLGGLFDAGASNPVVKKRLQAEAGVRGAPALHARLQRCDPAAAERLHPNDTARIVRALEVFEVTGTSIIRHQNGHRFRREPFRVLKIGLFMDRDALYARIDRRVDAMISGGLVEEVERLLHMGCDRSLKSMQAIGYRHIGEVLAGQKSLSDAVAELKRDTRRYAKRQMTWFRADAQIQWLHPGQIDTARALIASFVPAAGTTASDEKG